MLLQYYIRRESYSRLFPPHCPAISCHLPENSIFDHLPPFAPAYGRPPYFTSTFIDKNVNTVCCYYDIYGKKSIPGCFHPMSRHFPLSAWKFNFWPFFPHLRLLMGNPLTLPPLLLTKKKKNQTQQQQQKKIKSNKPLRKKAFAHTWLLLRCWADDSLSMTVLTEEGAGESGGPWLWPYCIVP